MSNTSQNITILLVHGAWHGAWCWKKVIPLMHQKGFNTIAIDLPGMGDDDTDAATITLHDYVNKITDTANTIDGKIVLVGHSSGGTVIAQAAELLGKEKVKQLIFLDAFMPADGESVFSIVGKYEMDKNGNKQTSLAESMIFSADGKTCTLDTTKVRELLYHDCSEEDVNYSKAHLGAQPLAALAMPVQLSNEQYGAIPKYYILCTQAKDFDKTEISTNVPYEKIYRLSSSHSPFFSMPEELVNVLEEIIG